LHVVYSAGGLLPRERQNSVVSFSWKHMVHRLRPVRDSVAVFNVDAIYFFRLSQITENDNIGRNAIIPSDMIRVFRYTAVKKAGKISVVCACKLTSVFQKFVDFYFREFSTAALFISFDDYASGFIIFEDFKHSSLKEPL